MKPMLTKVSKSSLQRPAKFIAPGKLARVYGQKPTKPIGDSSDFKTTSQDHRLLDEEEESDYVTSHGTGGVSTHTLIINCGEDAWEESGFTEDCCLLDILRICKKFVDIYSIGYKLTDGDHKPLRNDKDVVLLMEEHEGVERIDIYLDVDETAKPLLFKMPEDHPSLGGSSTSGDRRHVTVTEKQVEGPTQKKKKKRGANKNKKVATLRSGEKLQIEFFNNRAVGPNHMSWSRHLGKIIRDKNICPIQVKTWKGLTESDKEHMWGSVKECYTHPNIELYRERTLEHMCVLWTAWRSDMYIKNMRPCKTIAEALVKVPSGMSTTDWEWLVCNKYSTSKFQEISDQNVKNRTNGDMPHRTGSKPHRKVIFEKGGNLNAAEIFYETRQKGGKFVREKEKDKYDELSNIVKENPSLSQIQVIEKSFGPQRHNNVIGFGGGIKRKHLNGDQSAHVKELQAKLHEKEEENKNLRIRMDTFESRLNQIENGNHVTVDAPSTTTELVNDCEQAYTLELEAEVAKLRELNQELQKKQFC